MSWTQQVGNKENRRDQNHHEPEICNQRPHHKNGYSFDDSPLMAHVCCQPILSFLFCLAQRTFLFRAMHMPKVDTFWK